MIKEIGQVEINYSLCGSGGKKLLLLHGWGCDGSLMQPVADGLADQFIERYAQLAAEREEAVKA